MIPAAWTDYAKQSFDAGQSSTQSLSAQTGATLASVSEFLHARTVLVPLLRRMESTDIVRSKPATEVEPNATASELCARTIPRVRTDLGRMADAAERTTKRDSRRSRSPARKDGSGKRQRAPNRRTRGTTR
jgi:hypothetical protein